MGRVIACVLGLMGVLVCTGQASAEDNPVAGNWLLVGMQVGGNKVEPDQVGKLRVVLTADGKTQAYEDGKLKQEGWYELKENKTVVGYVDTNKNGKLDEDEKAAGQVSTYERVGDGLVLSQKLRSGTVLKMIFKPAEE